MRTARDADTAIGSTLREGCFSLKNRFFVFLLLVLCAGCAFALPPRRLRTPALRSAAPAAATAANGCPAALSALLGLDPSDPESRVRFDGIDLGGGMVKLSLRAGELPLPPETPFALQGSPALDEDWSDLSVVTRTPGRWETPVSASRFFRVVLRW